MSTTPQPTTSHHDGDGLRLLDASECYARLAAHTARVGRIAFLEGGYPIVLPVNYILLDGDVVFRTGLGSKLDAAMQGGPISFQVDEVDPQWLEGWSVLIKGRAEELTGPALQRTQLRRLRPWGPGSKPRYLRVATEVITGRQLH
jgi:uncharacterized protein